MKKILFYLSAAASICLVGCSKNTYAPGNGENTIRLTATSSIGSDTKAAFSDLTEGSYPLVWNAEEKAVIDEFVSTTKSQEIYSKGFVRKDAKKGNFSFELEAKEGDKFEYFVITPGKAAGESSNPTHGWRACKTGNISYIINHTVNQVPLADNPDPDTHVMVARASSTSGQATSLNLDFVPVVSYGKMTIKGFPALASGETVSKITITAPAGKYMSGRYYENIQTGERTPYNDNNIKNYVTIDPKNISFNTTGFDVWFTTFSLDLAVGDALSVSVETSVNKYDANLTLSKALSFKNGKVSSFTYNWAKGQPQAQTRTLTFDFSVCPQGWPSGSDEYKSKDHSTKTLPYVLDGVTYNFVTAVCLDLAATSTRSIAWGFDGTNNQSYFVSQPERFFGLPAIEGWKLITFKFTQACSTNSSRKVCITSAITNQTKQSEAYVAGGEPQATTTNGTEYTYNLTGTSANTVYYFAPTAKGNGFATITLVYEKVD